MFQFNWPAPRGWAHCLCLLVIYALVVSLMEPAALGQGPLPSPSPGEIIPPPLSAPGHPPGPTVPPPHPPNGIPVATLPNIDVARNLLVQPLPVPTPVTPLMQIRCDYDCGGDDPPPGGGSDPDFSTARVRPQNETGQAGVDLGSRNFNWSLPLVSLSGRAGLNLNLALYYNSLVWTPEGSSIRFNSDRAFL